MFFLYIILFIFITTSVAMEHEVQSSTKTENTNETDTPSETVDGYIFILEDTSIRLHQISWRYQELLTYYFPNLSRKESFFVKVGAIAHCADSESLNNLYTNYASDLKKIETDFANLPNHQVTPVNPKDRYARNLKNPLLYRYFPLYIPFCKIRTAKEGSIIEFPSMSLRLKAQQAPWQPTNNQLFEQSVENLQKIAFPPVDGTLFLLKNEWFTKDSLNRDEKALLESRFPMFHKDRFVLRICAVRNPLQTEKESAPYEDYKNNDISLSKEFPMFVPLSLLRYKHEEDTVTLDIPDMIPLTLHIKQCPWEILTQPSLYRMQQVYDPSNHESIAPSWPFDLSIQEGRDTFLEKQGSRNTHKFISQKMEEDADLMHEKEKKFVAALRSKQEKNKRKQIIIDSIKNSTIKVQQKIEQIVIAPFNNTSTNFYTQATTICSHFTLHGAKTNDNNMPPILPAQNTMISHNEKHGLTSFLATKSAMFDAMLLRSYY